MLGYTVSIAAVLILLKKKYGLRYFTLIKTFLKVCMGLVPMIAVVLVLMNVIPFTGGRLIQFVLMAVVGVVGAAVYGLVTYKNRAISDVFGDDFLKKILVKLHLKKA